MFNPKDCAIPNVWCGKGNPPSRKKEDETYYFRTGTRYECMKKGFGSGMHSERNSNLPETSLQKIKYVGKTYEEKFARRGIDDVVRLVEIVRDLSAEEVHEILSDIFSKRNGGLDKKAYNSTLLYLYHHGNGILPQCQKITPSEY